VAALFDQMLGSFDLAQTVELFPGRHRNPSTLASTKVHEEGHKQLAHITTLGWLQTVYAMLLAYPALKSIPERAEAIRNSLCRSIAVSWNTHEGYATYREFFLGETLGFSTDEKGLPRAYREARTIGQRIELMLPASLRPFSLTYVQVIFETAMNVDLPPLDANDLLDAQWAERYFAQAENQPDLRLAQICEALAESPVDERSWQSLSCEVWRILRDFAPGASESDMVRTYFGGMGADSRVPRVAIINLFTDFVERHLQSIAPKLVQVRIADAMNVAMVHYENLRVALATWQIDLPSRFRGAEADTAIAMEDCEYRLLQEIRAQTRVLTDDENI
jgi:hypothetical protein